MKLALIREGKVPPDSRVPLTPEQCAYVLANHPVEIVVEPSPIRCFADDEYREAGIALQNDLSDADVLLGVKEVPVEQLIPGKTYFFFSHTIKKQAYNRRLLQTILEKRIRLIDYEVLTDLNGRRLIAFGRFAGMVGAHNALYTFGRRSGLFSLKRMSDCRDYREAIQIYSTLELPPLRIVLTGTGRVANGSAEVLRDMGILEVSPEEFLNKDFTQAVFTQLSSADYVACGDGKPYDAVHYHTYPDQYRSIFKPYTRRADIFINGIYWDNRAPQFFSLADMREPDFRIQVIADVTCDIAPASSVPSTIRPSSIADPVYGYDPETEAETAPYQPHAVDVMAIDNLPNELPRDASSAFGQMFIRHVLPELLQPQSDLLERATVATDGKLGRHFGYLKEYVEAKLVD